MQTLHQTTCYQLIGNDTWGGGEVYALEIGQHLQAAGYAVRFVSRDAPKVLQKLQETSIPIALMPLKGIGDWHSAWKLSRLIRHEKSVVLHAHNFKSAYTAVFARMLARHKDCKIVVTRHLARQGKSDFLHRWLYAQIDEIVCVSQLVKTQFLTHLPSLSTRCTVIYNAIELPAKREPSIDIRRDYHLKASQLVMMYHGRICAEKGIDILIDMMATLPQDAHAVLCLIGDGKAEDLSALREQCDRLGVSDSVIWLGFQHNVVPLLEQCDIGLLASRVEEAFSFTCLEYMACGKPLVCPHRGGQTELVINGYNGLYAQMGDAASFAQQVERLLRDKKWREEMGENGKQRYESLFTYPRFMTALLEIYESRTELDCQKKK